MLYRAATAVAVFGGGVMIWHGEHRQAQLETDPRAEAQVVQAQAVTSPEISPMTEVDAGLIAGGIGGLVVLGSLAEAGRRHREAASKLQLPSVPDIENIP